MLSLKKYIDIPDSFLNFHEPLEAVTSNSLFVNGSNVSWLNNTKTDLAGDRIECTGVAVTRQGYCLPVLGLFMPKLGESVLGLIEGGLLLYSNTKTDFAGDGIECTGVAVTRQGANLPIFGSLFMQITSKFDHGDNVFFVENRIVHTGFVDSIKTASCEDEKSQEVKYKIRKRIAAEGEIPFHHNEVGEYKLHSVPGEAPLLERLKKAQELLIAAERGHVIPE